MIRCAALLSLALALPGCVLRSVYEAEVARSRGLEVAVEEREARIDELAQRIADLEKTGERLELERSSLDQERIDLIDELENLREGNAIIREELERERDVRRSVQAEVSELAGTYKSLVEELEKELEAGQIQIQELEGRLQVRALDQILFASGRATLSEQGHEVLGRVASQLAEVKGYGIRVEGHTDDVPISTERFPSNWELSVARASGVVRALADSGVDPRVLEAVGYGPYRPIAPNDSRENRARNRRIEIVLAPRVEAEE